MSSSRLSANSVRPGEIVQSPSGRLRVVVCVPAYSEEKTIAKVIVRAKQYADEVVVCDDGSTDSTREIADALGVAVLRHEKNRGKGAALRDLMQHARTLGPCVVVTMDSDGQHDPSEIPRLVGPIVKGDADIVVGSRYLKESQDNVPLYRRLGLSLINWLSGQTAGDSVKDTQCGFRAFSLKALEALGTSESEGFGVG